MKIVIEDEMNDEEEDDRTSRETPRRSVDSHVIADCPGWEEKPRSRWKYLHCNGFTRMDHHTKLPKKNESPSLSSSMRPVTDVQAKATIESNMKKISQLNRVITDMRMHSEYDTSDSDFDDEEHQRRIGRSNAFIAYE